MQSKGTTKKKWAYTKAACRHEQNVYYYFKLTWWVHEVEVHQVIDTQFLQLQHHRAQIRPQNLWICVVLRQLRNPRNNSKWISQGAYYLLARHSCVNLNRGRESRAFEGLFNLFKKFPLPLSVTRRISLLKWRTEPLQVHLSQGGCFVSTGYEKGQKQCGLAPSSWNCNSAELGIMEFKEQILHNRELIQLEGCFGGIQSACGIEECENSTPHRISNHFQTALFLTCISVL